MSVWIVLSIYAFQVQFLHPVYAPQTLYLIPSNQTAGANLGGSTLLPNDCDSRAKQ